jgi:hypothetical protein
MHLARNQGAIVDGRPWSLHIQKDCIAAREPEVIAFTQCRRLLCLVCNCSCCLVPPRHDGMTQLVCCLRACLPHVLQHLHLSIPRNTTAVHSYLNLPSLLDCT